MPQSRLSALRPYRFFWECNRGEGDEGDGDHPPTTSIRTQVPAVKDHEASIKGHLEGDGDEPEDDNGGDP